MTLGILVGRFGTFVRDNYAEPEIPAPQIDDFADDLARLRDAFAHHLIPLLLLARADGQSALAERQAILAHCIDCAERLGMPASQAEQAALEAYIESFRPNLMQLDPALRRLERASLEEIAALLAAAQAVMDADGERRAEELRLIAEFQDELAKLSA